MVPVYGNKKSPTENVLPISYLKTGIGQGFQTSMGIEYVFG